MAWIRSADICKTQPALRYPVRIAAGEHDRRRAQVGQRSPEHRRGENLPSIRTYRCCRSNREKHRRSSPRTDVQAPWDRHCSAAARGRKGWQSGKARRRERRGNDHFPASIALMADARRPPSTVLATSAPAKIAISRPPMNREDGMGVPATSTFTRQSRASGSNAARDRCRSACASLQTTCRWTEP